MKRNGGLILGGVLLLAVTIGLIGAYHRTPELRDTLEFAAAVIGGAGVIFSALYGFAVARDAAAESRRRRSLELIDQMNQRELNHIWATVQRQLPIVNVDHTINPFEVGAIDVAASQQLLSDAKYLLGLWEDLALSIRARVADEQVLYDSLSFALPASYKNFRPFIEWNRKIANDRTIYEEFETLVDCWEKGISYGTKKRLPRIIAALPPVRTTGATG